MRCRLTLVLLLVLVTGIRAAAADPPSVVASIRPLHGLAAALMRGIGEPRLLLGGTSSPHGYTMRPSQARDLQEADLILLAGAGIDRFVERHLQADGGQTVIRMSEVDGVHTLPIRAPGFAAADEHDHDHADGGSEAVDPHLWLDPRNALAMLDATALRLADLDPPNARTYERNRAEMHRRIEALDQTTADSLGPAAGRPLITFHDGLQYFTARYRLVDAGSIASDPERAPGARTILLLRERLADLGPVCLALEPGPEPPLLEPLSEGLPVVVARVDPLGRSIPAGKDHYERLIGSLAAEVLRCLTAAVPAP